jgi:hypothetical protein
LWPNANKTIAPVVIEASNIANTFATRAWFGITLS